jgi:hypothetical protein
MRVGGRFGEMNLDCDLRIERAKFRGGERDAEAADPDRAKDRNLTLHLILDRGDLLLAVADIAQDAVAQLMIAQTRFGRGDRAGRAVEQANPKMRL